MLKQATKTIAGFYACYYLTNELQQCKSFLFKTKINKKYE